MIKIKPTLEDQGTCPTCGRILRPFRVLWQGQHTCGVYKCSSCQISFIEDFKMMFSRDAPFQVNLSTGEWIQLYGKEEYLGWFGKPLGESIANPQQYPDLTLHVEKIHHHKEVVIINCLDFLYGHSLIKLFDIEYYLQQQVSLGVIVIIPDILRWLVPAGVGEIWTVNIPLRKMLNFYPGLDQKINKECERFDVLYLSKGIHQPAFFNMTKYTGVEKHNFQHKNYRITFIWRSDRVWCPAKVYLYAGTGVGVILTSLTQQKENICKLFAGLRISFPQAVFCVAGLGREMDFPDWIDDCRVESYTPALEQTMCQIYAQSRLVIGVHGSNMLLPSAHAGLTIDLLPDDRWGNLAQDIIYQEIPMHKVVHKYLHLPIATDIELVSKIGVTMINASCEQ